MNRRRRKKMWRKYYRKAGGALTWRERDYIRHYYSTNGLGRDISKVFHRVARAVRVFTAEMEKVLGKDWAK